MLNFQAVRNEEITFADLVADLTNEMVDTMLRLIGVGRLEETVR